MSDEQDHSENVKLSERTANERECRHDDCEETRFSQIGMEYHLLRDHERP